MLDDTHDRFEAAVTDGSSLMLSTDELAFMARLGFGAWLRSAAEAERSLRQAERPSLDKAIYTPADLAERWGVSSSAVSNLIRSGRLKGFRLGAKLVRVRRDQVEAFEGETGFGQ